MPAPGDQHRAAATATNPFEEAKPRVNEYTAQEIATLSSRLEKQLGPEYISSRPGASGQKVHYLAAEKCINLANEVFGFNGWSSSIQSTQIDFVDESQSSGKISLGLSVIMRVTLRDGTYHEDVGYGHIENCKGKAAAFEKAKKEGTTDALKRALRNFGNILGNCIYDKEYLAKVTKIKIAPSKWDADNLHRHPDFAPIKKESIDDAECTKSASTLDGEDEFGGDELDDADFSVANSGHPDEVTLDHSGHSESLRQRGNITRTGQTFPAGQPAGSSVQQARPPPPRPLPSGPQTPTHARNMNNLQPQGRFATQQNYNPNAVQKPPNRPIQQHQQIPHPLPPTNHQQRPQIPPPHAHQNSTSLQSAKPAPLSGPNSPNQKRQQHQYQQHHQQSGTLQRSTPPCNDPSAHPPPAQDPGPINLAFVTARAADSLQNINTNNSTTTLPQPPTTALFNPHSESPSIRKTAGIDHRTSKPIVRDTVVSSPAPSTTTNIAPVSGMGMGRSPMTTNFVNPQADQNRRIGMPPAGMASPLQNRNSYKPPTMVGKRGLGSDQQGLGQGQGQQRPPLGDVTAGSVNVPVGEAGIGVGGSGGMAVGGDVKRQRVGNGEGARGFVTG